MSMTGAVELVAIRELNSTMRGLAAILNAQIQAQRANLKQFYSVRELADRWCLPESQVLALLTRHGMYEGKRGVSPRFHLDQVLAMDQILKDGR